MNPFENSTHLKKGEKLDYLYGIQDEEEFEEARWKECRKYKEEKKKEKGRKREKEKEKYKDSKWK